MKSHTLCTRQASSGKSEMGPRCHPPRPHPRLATPLRLPPQGRVHPVCDVVVLKTERWLPAFVSQLYFYDLFLP